MTQDERTGRASRGAHAVTTDLPRWIWAPAALGLAFILVPLAALVLRAEWGDFWPLLTSESSLDALALSLRTALVSTGICLVIGIPLATVFARARFPGQQALRAFVLVPLVLPPVVGGIALLYAFGRRGLVGQALGVVGVQIPFTEVAVVMAQTFVALPFLVMSVEGALRSAGTRYGAIAATLGASPGRVLWRVTLPLIAPGILSGAILSFSRALGEFGATLAFAGSLQGVTRTLPLQVYLVRESDSASAVALSLVLIVLAVIGVVLAYRPRRVQP
ncbi:ABC transporter permease [Microbacterium betulae]|uniref:Molybdenum transport system permease n=1 Tax=Microbacterium betulae TaxID=2981139 RepID=A0AA97FGU6_9MICO|nr:ABC transporter permease [Microbacterium sp. AB]WOF23301.1 ABC transporter permease [Microbacterium sp. AB]